MTDPEGLRYADIPRMFAFVLPYIVIVGFALAALFQSLGLDQRRGPALASIITIVILTTASSLAEHWLRNPPRLFRRITAVAYLAAVTILTLVMSGVVSVR